MTTAMAENIEKVVERTVRRVLAEYLILPLGKGSTPTRVGGRDLIDPDAGLALRPGFKRKLIVSKRDKKAKRLRPLSEIMNPLCVSAV